MQVVDALSDVHGELFAIVPSHLDAKVVQKTPKRTSCAVLKHYAQIRRLGTRAKEQDNVWMSDHLHDCAFVLKFFEFILLDNLTFDLFDGNYCMLPTLSIYDTIPALW